MEREVILKKFHKYKIVIVLLFLGFLSFGSRNALADNGFVFLPRVDQNEDYPICKELLKIINQPENANASAKSTKIKEVIFSPANKNFSTVQWTPITLEEAKSSALDGYLEKIIEEETKRAIIGNKDWDGKGDFLFEKAEIDIDNHPPAETMIRYRIPVYGSWFCFLSKDAPNPGRDYFNPKPFSLSGCQPVFYGGRVYVIHSDLGGMYVSKPESVDGYEPEFNRWYLYNRQICSIDKINTKRTKK